jgi:hypothetical protein
MGVAVLTGYAVRIYWFTVSVGSRHKDVTMAIPAEHGEAGCQNKFMA